MTKRNGGDAVERLLLRQTALILLSSRQPSERRREDLLQCLLSPVQPVNGQTGRLSELQTLLIREILDETRM